MKELAKFKRLAKFAFVGGTCGVVQLIILNVLVESLDISSNLGKNAANSVAFFVSVQLNFVLSYMFTWNDRVDGTGIVRRFFQFNAMMLASLVANQIVFAVAIHFFSVTISGIIGIVAGAIINLFVSNKVIFSRQVHQGQTQGEEAVKTISIAVAMPAYNEEANIEVVVQDSIKYLESAVWITDYRLVVVNDGSKDRTPEILQELSKRYPKLIVVHQENGGYGAAVRKGLAVGSTTGMDWIHFMDSDQQFRLKDLELFRLALEQGKTFIAGIRMNRANSLERRVKGWLWTFGCSVVMGRWFPDIDCAFKLIRMDLLGDAFTLKGEGSTINPEIILRATKLGAKFVHIGVNHYPRGGGVSSCESMHFILQSVVSLFKLRFAFVERLMGGKDALKDNANPAGIG